MSRNQIDAQVASIRREFFATFREALRGPHQTPIRLALPRPRQRGTVVRAALSHDLVTRGRTRPDYAWWADTQEVEHTLTVKDY